jgi:DNA-directed RNA polymerase subunit L
MSSAVIINITKLNNEKHPLLLNPIKIKFTLNNVPVCIANAIKRTSIDELKTKRFIVESDAIEYSSPFTITDDIAERIHQIPILQSVNPLDKFSIKVDNRKIITSNDIDSSVSKPVCNATFIICEFENPSKFHINSISIVENYGYIDGVHNTATRVSLVSNRDESKSILVSGINITNHEMEIETNGEFEIVNFVYLCCQSIISRLELVLKNLENNLHSVDDRTELVVEGETYTIGEIIRVYTIKQNKSLSVFLKKSSESRKIIIQFKPNNIFEINDTIKFAINDAITDLKNIKDTFK